MNDTNDTNDTNDLDDASDLDNAVERLDQLLPDPLAGELIDLLVDGIYDEDHLVAAILATPAPGQERTP